MKLLISTLTLLLSTKDAAAKVINWNDYDAFPQQVLKPHNVEPPHLVQNFQKRGQSTMGRITCANENFILSSSNDLKSIEHCHEIVGDLIVTSTFDSPVLDLYNLQTLKGNFVIEDCQSLIRLSAPQLENVQGDFTLSSLTSLVTVELPTISHVNSLTWKVLPILSQADLPKDIIVDKNIIISDTSLSNINDFQSIKDVEIFNVNNNRFLETIKTNVETVRGQLSIHANSRELELEMPYLQNAENLTVRDTRSVWLPNLQRVNTNMEFIENLFADLDLSSLKFVGGTLGIIDNSNLHNLDFNNVTEVQGGLMVTNNINMEKIDCFKSLKLVGGAIYFEGTFTDTDFPYLRLVKGSAFVKTTSNDMNCNKWVRPQNGRSIVRGGKIQCTASKKQNSISLDENGSVTETSERDISIPKVVLSNYASKLTYRNWVATGLSLVAVALLHNFV
ncbi:Sps22p KNAG_0C00340 [Huiozyma naganishii CBS 8797]|uniref:Receptor L-domain domain-containing protein n=1 Tax=Huiozyma naganishii (strain ATCC MYA-139 / BCRC 22969 / CBS 8797 / KCTC 17520 / NBRC 10181 / NCYC 3082 / Yp74L-3) TaxID=1071383 RepID=J7RHX4_HUIN7|nr:hypothetical protein KNAG_0C00340 [Kazachstania naganishii CBS 8797]CCK69148.1 hypothetical protein KNAG_0C00340 [Kazachstania naganishii CBS 8797]